jgi:hypothetical protein
MTVNNNSYLNKNSKAGFENQFNLEWPDILEFMGIVNLCLVLCPDTFQGEHLSTTFVMDVKFKT